MTNDTQAINLFGDPVYFSPDVTDVEPHTGFCADCGAPAPYTLRSYIGLEKLRLCLDSEACRERRIKLLDDTERLSK